jgi:hypothetical protein
MKKDIVIYCFLAFTGIFPFHSASAQDLTGIWRGHFSSNDELERLTGNEYRFRTDDRYKMEVQIAQTHNRFDAVTYSYKTAEFYCKAEASGTLNIQSKKVLLKEGKVLEVRFANGFVCTMTCFMQYTRLGNDEYLQGTFYSSNSKDSSIDCGKGSIFLHRVAESDFHKEPFLIKKEKELLAHKNDRKLKSNAVVAAKPATTTATRPAVPTTKPPAATAGTMGKKSPAKTSPVKKQPAMAYKPTPPAVEKKSTVLQPDHIQTRADSIINAPQPLIPVPMVLKNRTNELLKTLTVNHNTIELRIYDDGAIDNDTVSVYYDNKIIVSKARLSDLPIIVKIQVEPSGHPHTLVMVAENLGEIPPNTSLLVVRDGEKRYEERIISTEQKNVMINFIYKKIE